MAPHLTAHMWATTGNNIDKCLLIFRVACILNWDRTKKRALKGSNSICKNYHSLNPSPQASKALKNTFASLWCSSSAKALQEQTKDHHFLQWNILRSTLWSNSNTVTFLWLTGGNLLFNQINELNRHSSSGGLIRRKRKNHRIENWLWRPFLGSKRGKITKEFIGKTVQDLIYNGSYFLLRAGFL